MLSLSQSSTGISPFPRLTGAIQFSSADMSLQTPTNPRGYNDGGTPGLRQINTLAGAKQWLAWQLPMLPPAQAQTTGFIFWDPGGDLSSTLQRWPIDYASGLEMAMPGWELVASTLTNAGIPFGICCRPAEHNYALADCNNPIHVLWLQRQIERCLKLFPPGAKRIWYCDSIQGNAVVGRFADSLGMLKHMRDFVGPNDLLLPECAAAMPDERSAFIEVAGGCYSEMTTPEGADYWTQNVADVKSVQAKYPSAVFLTKSWGNKNFTAAQIRAAGRVPLTGDYPGGAGLL